jgi:hypothetical protein
VVGHWDAELPLIEKLRLLSLGAPFRGKGKPALVQNFCPACGIFATDNRGDSDRKSLILNKSEI